MEPVTRLDIAEIYFAHAEQAIRDLHHGTDEQAEDADERFMKYNQKGFWWQNHHEWVEARKPKRVVAEDPMGFRNYMDDM